MLKEKLETIKQEIHDSPRDPERLRDYHSKLIHKIDSTIPFGENPMLHRAFHQMIWITGHKILEGMEDEFNAGQDWTSNVHRDRFNLWYAKTYGVNGTNLNYLKEISMQIYGLSFEKLTPEDILSMPIRQ